MIVERYKCNKCGQLMDEPRTKIRTHSDIYWGCAASVHLCKKCSAELMKWLKDKPLTGNGDDESVAIESGEESK